MTNGNGSATGGSPLIRLQDVSKVFLTEDLETHALSGVQMEVAKGEWVAIAGPSGCGAASCSGTFPSRRRGRSCGSSRG